MIRLTLAAAAALLAVSAHAQLTAPPGLTLPPAAPSAPAPSAPPQQQDPMTPEFRECVKKTTEAMEATKQQNFPAILGCLMAEVKRQEAKLARSTEKLAPNLIGGEKKLLDDANAAWRRFRDANCSFYADPKAPPPANLEHADCQLNLTIGRAQEIESLVANAARRAEAKGAAKK